MAQFRHSSFRVVRSAIALSLVALVVAGCGNSKNLKQAQSAYSPRVVNSGEPVPRGGGAYKVGKPYKIKGRTYVPQHMPDYDRVGVASWYGDDFHGRLTANGEVYDMYAYTAAHPTLPLPTYARVTNMENGKSVVVRINDRGPFAHDRIIDLSKRTAEILDFKRDGTAKVRVQYVGRAPLDGEDKWLTTTVRQGTDERVAALDKALAARAFASDGRGSDHQVFASAERAYASNSFALAEVAPPAEPVPVRRDVPVAPQRAPRPEAPRVAFAAVSPETAPQLRAGAFSTPAEAQAMARRLQPYGAVSVSRITENGRAVFAVDFQPGEAISAGNALAEGPQLLTAPSASPLSPIY